MGFSGDASSIKYTVVKDYDAVFDEKGSTFGSIRKVIWAKEGQEIDPEKAKLEIRKIYVNPEGERTGKGYVFSTEDGAHELTENMVKIGFGHTKELLRGLKKRKDFKESVENLGKDDDEDYDGEFFDMRDMLLTEDGDETETDDDE